jgi:type II secretory pathway pseudopilin PulG
MKLNGTIKKKQGSTSAFTLAEVVVAVLLLGVLTAGLLSAFSSGLSVVQSAREDQRATQLLMQKTETLRLLTWSLGTNATYAPTNFTDYYDPAGTNTHTAGATYAGYYSVTPAPTNLPAAYRPNVRLITVTVYWTNYPAHKRVPIVHCRQMQTQVARYGMQNYIYK